jgi:hypothetical protein
VPAAGIGLRAATTSFPGPKALEDAAALRHQRHAACAISAPAAVWSRRAEHLDRAVAGGNSPTVTFMQVDLPAPLRPKAQQPAFAERNDTFCRTWLSP